MRCATCNNQATHHVSTRRIVGGDWETRDICGDCLATELASEIPPRAVEALPHHLIAEQNAAAAARRAERRAQRRAQLTIEDA